MNVFKLTVRSVFEQSDTSRIIGSGVSNDIVTHLAKPKNSTSSLTHQSYYKQQSDNLVLLCYTRFLPIFFAFVGVAHQQNRFLRVFARS
jgi:hypothetical protein